MAFSFLKSTSITLTLICILLFFILKTPSSRSQQIPRRSLLDSKTNTPTCSSLEAQPSDGALFNYLSLHFCHFNNHPFISLSFLSLTSLLFFYILIKTAQSHFSLVTTKLSSMLNLSPSMAAVTLLALGNGSPDVFSSVQALRSGHYRTGFGAILSAGAFVSAFVVGFVAIYAAPFSVDAGCFVRDVGFYLVAALLLFYVYLSGEIFVWQAVGFVGFYLFFVGIVFWTDLGLSRNEKRSEMEMTEDCEIGQVKGLEQLEKNDASGFARVYGMVCFCFYCFL